VGPLPIDPHRRFCRPQIRPNPVCTIPRVGYGGSLTNIANIITYTVHDFRHWFDLWIIFLTSREKPLLVSPILPCCMKRPNLSICTGYVELCTFLTIYLLTLPLQLITSGSLLTQGSTSLVVLTALHAGAVANLFWSLLANTIIATQVVEDGMLSSLILSALLCLALSFFTDEGYSP